MKKLEQLLLFPLRILIRIYQLFLSPLLGQNCKFTPTCSSYTLEALKTHGVKGIWLSTKRILTCTPWNSKSGYDPVPKKHTI